MTHMLDVESDLNSNFAAATIEDKWLKAVIQCNASTNARLMAFVMRSLANNGLVIAKPEALAALVGRHRDTVFRILKELEWHGLIVREGSHMTRSYRLTLNGEALS